MTERHALLDAIYIRGMHAGCTSQRPAALGVFGLQQMAFAGARAQDFAAGGDLEPLGCGLFGLNAFWTSHKSIKFLTKRARNIGRSAARSKGYFKEFGGLGRSRGRGRRKNFFLIARSAA